MEIIRHKKSVRDFIGLQQGSAQNQITNILQEKINNILEYYRQGIGDIKDIKASTIPPQLGENRVILGEVKVGGVTLGYITAKPVAKINAISKFGNTYIFDTEAPSQFQDNKLAIQQKFTITDFFNNTVKRNYVVAAYNKTGEPKPQSVFASFSAKQLIMVAGIVLTATTVANLVTRKK